RAGRRAATGSCQSVSAKRPQEARGHEPDQPAARCRVIVEFQERRSTLLEGQPLAIASNQMHEQFGEIGLVADEDDDVELGMGGTRGEERFWCTSREQRLRRCLESPGLSRDLRRLTCSEQWTRQQEIWSRYDLCQPPGRFLEALAALGSQRPVLVCDARG